MADNTKIEWTDATWNVITGCSVVSPGCTNCYAMKLAGGRLKHTASREGLTDMTKAGPVWNGQVRFNEYWLDQPLNWSRSRRVFFCAHGDPFHDAVEVRWLDLSFAVMAASPEHTFQVLTKRAAGMKAYFAGLALRGDEILKTIKDNWTGWSDAKALDVATKLVNWGSSPLPNVMLGVSAEDQDRADERVAELLSIPAAFHWVSHEPALGPVNFRSLKPLHTSNDNLGHRLDALAGTIKTANGQVLSVSEGCIDWIVSGGESGAGARPSHPEWYRRIRNDCEDTGVVWNFKQWGNWYPIDLPDGAAVDLNTVGPGKVPVVTVPEGQTAPVIKKGHMLLVGFPGSHSTMAPVALMRRGTKREAGALLDGVGYDLVPVLPRPSILQKEI